MTAFRNIPNEILFYLSTQEKHFSYKNAIALELDITFNTLEMGYTKIPSCYVEGSCNWLRLTEEGIAFINKSR